MDKQAIETLKRLNQVNLEEVYRRVFETVDGAVILEDLKARFFEYAPTSTPFEAGQQSVLIHLKNLISPLPKVEDGDANQSS
jgi:hypothetical protein